MSDRYSYFIPLIFITLQTLIPQAKILFRAFQASYSNRSTKRPPSNGATLAQTVPLFIDITHLAKAAVEWNFSDLARADFLPLNGNASKSWLAGAIVAKWWGFGTNGAMNF